jgi:hypothetical protein
MCFALFLEAEKQQLINEAMGAAEAVVAAGKARAQSIEMVRSSLNILITLFNSFLKLFFSLM